MRPSLVLRAGRGARARSALVLAGALALGACTDKAQLKASADSLAAANAQLAEAREELAQRDVLMGELAETTRLVNQIDSSLSNVRGLADAARKARGTKPTAGSPADPWTARQDSLRAKVDGVIRLLDQSRARAASLSKKNAKLEEQMRGYVATIEELRTTVTRQQGELAAFGVLVDSLQTAGRQLAVERDATRDTLRVTRDDANVVFYTIGTKEQLRDRGVVEGEGSRRFLLVGSRTLVPKRTLDASAFQRADQRDLTILQLPRAGANYRVVSRHDASLLVPGVGADGRPDGTLRITDPARFWSASKYLIIVQG